jgi:hypothetical protein
MSSSNFKCLDCNQSLNIITTSQQEYGQAFKAAAANFKAQQEAQQQAGVKEADSVFQQKLYLFGQGGTKSEIESIIKIQDLVDS